MSSLEEIRDERKNKIMLLNDAGLEAYPAESNRTHTNKDFENCFKDLLDSDAVLVLAGRIMSLRDQGGIIFMDIFDGTGRAQVILKRDDVGDTNFDLFLKTADQSDFMEFRGKSFVTKRGVNSLLADSWRMLAKSLRPVPDEWFGLKDEDERYRKRYIDILLNPETAETVRKRSIFWNSIRTFMLDMGFIEVETPTLETMTGGAEARPFITRHNTLDIDVYLRISVGELWQKKLMVAGIPKTFEIGRIFRNEGISHEHANDYTSFEFYEAYQDAREGVPMIIDLYRTVAEKTFGKTRFEINGFDVDLSREWDKHDFIDLMKEHYGYDFSDERNFPDGTLLEIIQKAGLLKEFRSSDLNDKKRDLSFGRAVDLLWKKVRKTIGGPAILTGIPVYLEPLAKKSTGNPKVVDRFQVLIAGSEVGKAFNELNDPIDQRERFELQERLREAGDEEAQMADLEYVEAMEYGMPPTFGFGVSERLFAFLAGKSIREAQTFPLMRPK